MRILLVLPPQNDTMEPLGMLYLAAALKQGGHVVQTACPNYSSVARVLRAFPADVLAYSVVTGSQQPLLELNRWVRKNFLPVALSVFGGPHPTYFPAFLDEEGVDGICVGEGEEAFVELANRLEAEDEFFRTQNWWIKYQDKTYRNSLRPEVSDLDRLPFPDRSALDAYPAYTNRHIRSFMASRGCPFSCSYCFNPAYQALYQRNGLNARVRRRSVDNLIAEVKSVREAYPLRSVAFYDDVFVTAPHWLDEFAFKYSRQIALPFECNLRVEQVDRKTLSALTRAGCRIVAVGIETADEEMRASVLNRKYTNEEVRRACALIHAHGLALKTYNILGLPPGGIDPDLRTLELNIAVQASLATASFFQPYPGTHLGDRAREEGYWDGDVNKIRLGFYSTCQLAIKDRSKIELLQKLFLITARFPFLLPVTKLILHLSWITPLRNLIFCVYRSANNLGLLLGRQGFFSESLRLLLLMRKPTHRETLS